MLAQAGESESIEEPIGHPLAPANLQELAQIVAIDRAYNAPIAGALFVAEIVLGSMAIRYIAPLVFASVVANATVHQFYGYAPVYAIPPLHYAGEWELALFLILGALLGIAAPAFMRTLEVARRLFRRLPGAVYVKLFAGGAIVGLISAFEPRV